MDKGSNSSFNTIVRALALLLLVAVCVFPVAHAADPDALSADGGRYYGPIVDGKRHGQGRIEWDTGARYEGGFVRGLYAGKGRLQLASGDVYEGEFVAGMMSGRGSLTLANSERYVGEFRNDVFQGQGRYTFPDGDSYEGAFERGRFHGQGTMTRAASVYRGEFRNGEFWGKGELAYDGGRKYTGEFVRGRFQGTGRYEDGTGDAYEGQFEQDEFTGIGAYLRSDGSRHEGGFRKWKPQGLGKFTDAQRTTWEGDFDQGEFKGIARIARKDGSHYEGQVRQWLPHGEGVLHYASGDVYRGGFAAGMHEGQGTLTYAKPKADGKTEESGLWHYGRLGDEESQQQRRAQVEAALYRQRALLDQSLAALEPRKENAINLYLLAVAGDGTQEVFRREAQFVRDLFNRQFGTRGRSIVLVNSRNTLTTAPMATVSSIREALAAIAERMDKERDVLFLFLTSHGSSNHEFVLDIAGMDLPSLPAKELGALLKESGIRWKVVVVAACYAGGFIDAMKDGNTLIIAAARHDRQSFGCADENEFTYFGRAYFKEALPGASSFQDAFRKAEAQVDEWEAKELKAETRTAFGTRTEEKDQHSLPQMENPKPVEDHLRLWWKQR